MSCTSKNEPEGLIQLIKSKISKPKFASTSDIWLKDECMRSIHQGLSLKRFRFSKRGKTFGLEAKRFIEYHKGVLYYFEVTSVVIQSEEETNYRKYCNL